MRDSCLSLVNRSTDLKRHLASLKYYCRIHVVLRDIPGILIESETCLHAQEGRSNIFGRNQRRYAMRDYITVHLYGPKELNAAKREYPYSQNIVKALH